MNKEEVFKAFVSFVEKKWERVLLPLSAEYEWNGCDGDTTIEKRREWSRELNAAVSSSDKEKILDDFIRGWGRIYLRDKKPCGVTASFLNYRIVTNLGCGLTDCPST